MEIRDHKRTKIKCKRDLRLLSEENSKTSYVKSEFVQGKKGLFLNSLLKFLHKPHPHSVSWSTVQNEGKKIDNKYIFSYQK